MLLQSEGVLTRPWCLLELYAAATAGIPIVSLVCSGKGYDSAAAEDHLLHLDTSLPALSPSAVDVLEDNGASVLRVAQVLWACVPNAISVPLNSSGSESIVRAAVADLVKAMHHAQAISAPLPADEVSWRAERDGRDAAVMAAVLAKLQIRGAQSARMLQRMERSSALERIIDELHAARAERTAELCAERAKRVSERAMHSTKRAELEAQMKQLEEKLAAA